MKVKSLGVLRCCAVFAILFMLICGIFQPVSAGPADIPDHQSSIIVLDYGPGDGVQLSGRLTWYDPLNSPKILEISIRQLVLESMHLEIDLDQQVMRGNMKFSGAENSKPLENGDYTNRNGEAIIKFDNIRLSEIQNNKWRIDRGSGTANIAMGVDYQITGLVDPDRPSIGSAYDNDPNVPVEYIFGELSNRLLMELDAYKDATQFLGAYIEILIPQIDLSNPQREQPQQEAAPNLSQEEQPQLEEAPDLSDSPNARFSISAGCDDSIASGQDIDCRVNIQRDSEDVGGLMVVWVMDGLVANQELVLGDSATFTFPNPPPGSHTVQVQVVDTDTADVLSSAMNVEVGGFASPDDAPNRIPAGAQTGSAVGTTALIGAWLWAEWMAARANTLAEERRDAKEAKDRQAWYEQQMARNDAVKARQQAAERHQQALEAEWKRYRDSLLETVKKHEKSEYLVDLLDDMQADVYRNGQWDAKGLRRLEGLIDTHLVMDRQHEVSSEWKRMWNFYKRQEAEANSILRGNAMSGVELVAGVLTQGASDLIFMPTKAIVSAVYARRRAMMLGKTGWDAAKSVMKESGTTLLTDYITGKAVGAVVNKALGAGAVVGRKIIGEEGVEALSNWWQRTGTKLGVIPKPAPELPVIRQSWGRGPQVYLDRPIYRPGSSIPIGVGFENGLDRIGRVNGALAEDMRRMIGEGAQVDPHLNNVLSPGNSSYTLTPQDEIARNLMNNTSYKQAVREGLVPPRVQQAVYQTRDKIAKNATMEAFQALDNVDLNGQAASSYIKSVTVTGTGARPLNPRAVGRYTDWDATVIAKDSGAVGRQAEELFTAKFHDSLRRAGVHTDTAEVTMFAGVHASPNAPAAGGYGSEGLTHWHKIDMTYQGQSAVRLEDGGVMFNAHPDAAPVTGFGPMEAAPRFPAVSEDVAADARRLIDSHITARVAETGGPLDPQTVLRMEGKHAARVWKVNNTGRGADMPVWMQKVMALKNDPNYHLSGAELDDVWQRYTDYLDLPSDLGGGR